VPNYGLVAQSTLTFSATQLTGLLGAKADYAEWETADFTDIEDQIAEVEARIKFLRHHTWADLCKRPEFTLPPTAPGVRHPSASASTGAPLNFDALVKETLESDLARDLVRRDFLTSHFALYSSSYYGEHLGPKAMEYISRCIEPGVPDTSFELGEDDVIQILREQGAAKSDKADLFSDASVRNVSVLDYLLEKRPAAAATVAVKLSRWGEQDREFVDTYVAQSAHGGALLASMIPTWPGGVRYAAVTAPVDSAARLGLLDAVLHAVPNDKYEVDADVRQLIESSYRGVSAITHPGSAERAGIVLRVIAASGAVLETLEELDDDGRDVAVELRLYPVTEANLRVLAPADSIALDVLRDDERVYRYAVDRLGDYLAAFDASPTTAHTVIDPRAFATILTDAAKDPDTALLGRLIASASDGCRIPSLAKVPKVPTVAWPFLAAGDRTDATFENAKDYIHELGVDEPLGSLLAKRQAITETEGKPETDRLEVAVAILAASKEIPEVETRVRLAASLEPGEVPATSIEPETGELVARLLGARLLADDAAAFSKRLMVDWATYEPAIAASLNFATFVSPDLLDASQVPGLLRSTAIPNEVMEAVVARLGDYLTGANPGEAQAVAGALDKGGWRLGFEGLEALRATGVDNGELIRLIATSGENLDIEHLKTLLRAMGEPYSKVAARGGSRPRFDDDEAHGRVLDRLVGDTISRVRTGISKGNGRQLVVSLLQSKG
jgi:hypothetical protein